jgi:hypothetical protein
MKLVLIFGNGAVGKMTVGQELTKITDLRLFHNHMTIEPVLGVFGEFNSSVIEKLRRTIFEEFAKSNKYGLIFTYMWAFDSKSDWDYISDVKRIFELYDTEFYHVELVASQEERLKRNVSENRLNNKASKRDIEASNKRILDCDQKYRLESYDGELSFEHYIKIDNTNLSAQEVAEIIKDRFKL